MGLGASGIALAGWFFFFSVNEYKFLWGLLSVVEFLVGDLIYRFAYAWSVDRFLMLIKRVGFLSTHVD